MIQQSIGVRLANGPFHCGIQSIAPERSALANEDRTIRLVSHQRPQDLRSGVADRDRSFAGPTHDIGPSSHEVDLSSIQRAKLSGAKPGHQEQAQRGNEHSMCRRNDGFGLSHRDGCPASNARLASINDRVGVEIALPLGPSHTDLDRRNGRMLSGLGPVWMSRYPLRDVERAEVPCLKLAEHRRKRPDLESVMHDRGNGQSSLAVRKPKVREDLHRDSAGRDTSPAHHHQPIEFLVGRSLVGTQEELLTIECHVPGLGLSPEPRTWNTSARH